MKIGIMSDSHDRLEKITKAVKLLEGEGAQALIHAGDFVAPFAVKEVLKFSGAVYGVFGNNDGEIRGIEALWERVYYGPYLFELGERRIVVSHSEAGLSRSPYGDVDVMIFGHSHKAEVREGRPLVINPGSAGGILAPKATCALLDAQALSAQILEVE